ncbi:hypothetical protein EBR66_01805 [bacterium]|nr:hypothetical protein [bacterium]
MNKVLIASFAVVIIALLGGAYYYFSLSSGAASQNNQNTSAQTPAAGDKVEAQEVKVGTGAAAVPGTFVSVLYEGKLENGTTFDSSAAHNNEPLVFELGTQGLIPGFQIGVNGMKEGGERVIAIPPALGYGDKDVKDPSGKVIIPANSKLIFALKLIKVEQKPANASSTSVKK